MTKLTITAKGQITLTTDLLKHLGVVALEKIEVHKLPRRRIMLRATAQESTVADFIGCLSQPGAPKLTIDELNETTAQGWANPKRTNRG